MRLGGNRNIAAGQVFDIDLMQAPFGLDAPLLAYNELTCALAYCWQPAAGMFVYEDYGGHTWVAQELLSCTKFHSLCWC